MKKLALIVLLAVVASRVLSDRDHRRHRPAPRPVSLVESSETSVATTTQDEPPAPPFPPLAPLPPPIETPGAIRVTPWNGHDRDAVPAPVTRITKLKRRSQTGKAPKTEVPAPPPKAAPAWFPKEEWEEEGLARPDASGARVLLGQISASPERALADLRKRVDGEVADWLAADVPGTWATPSRLLDRMVLGTHIKPVTWSLQPKAGEVGLKAPAADGDALAGLDEFHTLYRAGQKLDFSDDRRAEFVEAYRRDVASARMRRSGAVIAVILAVLAATSLYVRADEATKGYYTNRLRMLAALGLGMAGVAAYRYWA